MNLRAFVGAMPPDQRPAFAETCGTTIGHINNVMYGYKPCGPELAASIDIATAGAVSRRELRPDDWHRIWPELVTPEFPPPTPEKVAA